MECLVDDTVNSNLPPSCPICGIDTGGISSSELVVHCQNCERVDTNSGIDNSPVLQQSHRDVITSPSLRRPRCCSCLENSTPALSPSAHSPQQGGLDIPAFRPRSVSNPIQHSLEDQTALAFELHSSDVSSIQKSFDLLPQHSQTIRPQNIQGVKSPDHHCTNQIVEKHSSPQISKQIQQDIKSETSLNVGSSDIEGGISNMCQQSCMTCGGMILSEGHNPSHIPLSSNINTHPSLSYGVDTPSNDLNTDPVSTSTGLHEDNSSENLKLDVPLTKHEDKQTSALSSSTINSDEHANRVAIAKMDQEAYNTGHSSQTVQLTTSQMISHNRELNRITTTPTGRAHHSTKLSRRTGKNVPPRHSLQAGGIHSRVAGTDGSLSCLTSEMLHNLCHENEDLSADVVNSLNFRDYQIKELLGKGISSTVRRVSEKSTGAEYAVKIIDISGEKVEMSQVEQVKKDTSREIKILRMCAGHSNIIELHDVFETPTFIFLVFEICRKGELFDYLTSVVSLSEKRTRIFMRQLIEAVAFIHDKNIVHRDLKPENILLDDDLNIKVSDFGFATVIEPGEELTELCGTPGYLAPEVLAHSMYENVSGYSKEVDMWACGVIMYTLLCGAPPFWNRRQMMMLRAIMNADYTFNSPEWDDISDAPKNLIQKLLVVNPKDRLTAKEALQHPFFHSQVKEEKKFQARRKFRAGVRCVMFYLRLSFVYKHPPPMSMDMIKNNPYGIKLLRKVIDTCAFGMYKHWVKRVDNQNRAALFEHSLRDDWKHNPMTVDGISMAVGGI